MPSPTNSSNGSLTNNSFSFHLNSKSNPSLSWHLLYEKLDKNVHVNLIKQEQDEVVDGDGEEEDHGASSRHSIAKEFSGTILFIETKVVLHDALVPCIGGILGFYKLYYCSLA
ncbi:hypothetical protein MTR_7g017460 [Medicago truncatula]|uniref:Uncharacterized protein n=1 Tax=Medicago truncatula TaxID=3880 RepID=G7KS03_MEDTR|nr:hypothetical protein MTR_7g017460 [Medicago truncatula]